MQHNESRNPGKESATKLGRRSLLPLLTIRKKYSKFYFSSLAVTSLGLKSNTFSIKKQNEDWILIISGRENAKRLTEHNGAYYFVDRKLAKMMYNDFSGDPIKLKIEVTSRKEGKYILLQIDPGSFEKKRTERKQGPSFPPADKGYSTQHKQAMRMVQFYELTDFKGRVKTLDIIKAEKYLNQIKP